MQTQPLKRPTHALLTQFASSLLPPTPNDVPLLYHTPRSPSYIPSTTTVKRVVLSITPTPGVYEAINHPPPSSIPQPPSAEPPDIPPTTSPICILHRPFTLSPPLLPPSTLILASHTSFDENLTVGHNLPLASRLTLHIPTSISLRGYKNVPERKIGIVGEVRMLRSLLIQNIEREFGSLESVVVGGEGEEVGALAMMNAFDAGTVERVGDVVGERGWGDGGRGVLYLTGQARESGLVAAREAGMSVVCVGHRAAEEWGMRYLAGRMREAFPEVVVHEVYEEEVPVIRRKEKPREAT